MSVTRALVLGGGGSAGNAWVIGVVAGLVDAGVDVPAADLVIGTSAGATAAVQLMGADPLELCAAIEDAPVTQRSARGPGGGAATGAGASGSGAATGVSRRVVNHLERTGRIIAAAQDSDDMRRRMGAAAIEIAMDETARQRWRATVTGRLPSLDWPERPLLVTAVDAGSGDAVTFDRAGGVGLADAVAASCSSGPAYPIGDRYYIDGGYRRNENADLAAGHDRVVVLSPFGGRTRHPLEWRMQLAAQVEDLRAGGSLVEVIVPDTESVAAFGADMMDLSRRAPAARAGRRQGAALGEVLREFWG